MVVRFTDNIIENIEGTGFVARDRVPRALQIILTFALATTILYVTAIISNNSEHKIIFLFTLLIIIGLLAWSTIFFAHKIRTLVLATEFQNAMLASSAQLGTRFCLIANSDGIIAYIDPGFQRSFPYFMHGDSRTLAGLFAYAEIPDELNRKIVGLLKANQSDKMVLPFKDTAGNAMNIMTTIDALPRPKGYFLIRGRDFVEKRANTASGSLLEKYINTISGGFLIANTSGKIGNINQEFEKWLGYSTGEVVNSNLSLEKIIQQYKDREVGALLIEDYQGEAVLRRKDGTTTALTIQQKLLSENAEKVGISLTVKFV